MKKVLLSALILSSSVLSSNAQKINGVLPTRKPYISTGMDGYILSTTLKQKAGEDMTFSTPRFTAFFHLGSNINYDFNKNVGVFIGANIKNIGFIEKPNGTDSTIKRRVYTFGIPVALKLGNVKHGSYLMLGGGVDFPFNYKEKGFVQRNDKAKFNEWFSSRTPAAMPYAFIGAHLRPAFAFKLTYYPSNFMNPNFETSGGDKPYSNYDVQLVTFTFGFDISYRPKS